MPNKSQTQLASTTSTSATLSVSQLVVFNSIKQLRTYQPSANFRHELDRETPLPLYLGLKVHAVTRNKTLVNILNNLGLCVSYDRVLQIQSNISNRICKRYEEEKVVCPPNLRRDLFTIAAVNNIDHNPTSATAKDFFHGTTVSLSCNDKTFYADLVAIIKHSMDVVKAAVDYLNSEQVPVLAADHPLFALAKQIQWTWPATYGEDQFVIMFGGLHIEIAVL